MAWSFVVPTELVSEATPTPRKQNSETKAQLLSSERILSEILMERKWAKALVETVNSLQSRLIKDTKKLHQKKYRQAWGQYLVEGIRLVEEAWQAGVLEKVFYDDSLMSTSRGQQLLHTIKQSTARGGTIRLYNTSPEILRPLADTESPQGIVGVAVKRKLTLDTLEVGEDSLLIITDCLQDPGNLGTIIRTAWSAGVGGVVCLPGTVDPYNGKTVRATMGGIFHVPVVENCAWSLLREWCHAGGYQLVAGDLQAKKAYYEVCYRPKVALIIGNEARGLMTVQATDVSERVKIPMVPGAESLNASVSCGIMLYEVIRQRQSGTL